MTPEVRVLIVDDNSATRYALRRRLEQHDITILEAGTGGDGLALIASEPLDALILDVNLPDMKRFRHRPLAARQAGHGLAADHPCLSGLDPDWRYHHRAGSRCRRLPDTSGRCRCAAGDVAHAVARARHGKRAARERGTFSRDFRQHRRPHRGDRRAVAGDRVQPCLLPALAHTGLADQPADSNWLRARNPCWTICRCA